MCGGMFNKSKFLIIFRILMKEEIKRDWDNYK